MAKIVDVTDVPELPGAGLLHFDDGRPPLMALPEVANEHRERLGIDDQRLAMTPQQSTGGAKTRTDAESGPGAGFDVQHKNRWGGTFTTREDAPPSVDVTPPGPPPAATAAPAAAPPGPVPQQGAGGAPPGISAPPGQPPAVDPAAQARDAVAQQAADELLHGKVVRGGPARAAGYSPSAQKTVTEAGPAYDKQAAGERLDAGKNVLDAELAKAATEKQIADATAAHAAAQNLQAQQQLAHQQSEVQRKQANFQAQEKGFQNDIANYTQSAQPDPNHFIKNRTVVANIFGAIGQGLGAFGATLNHTQNYAFDYVQAQIKQDIAEQQERYQSGRADRKDALSRFVDYYHGDMDMAKAAMLQAQNKVAETETQNFAAQANSKEISANAQVLAAQFHQQQLLAEQQRAELAAGKTTTTTENKYHDAFSGASGRAPLTPAEQEARLKLLPKSGGVAQGYAALPERSVAKEQDTYGAKKEAVDNARTALDEEAKSYGLHIDPQTGSVLDKDNKPADASKLDIPGFGRLAGHAPDLLTSKEGRNVRRRQLDSTIAFYQAAHGITLTPEQAEKAKSGLIGDTDEDALASMQQRAKHLKRLDEQADASAAAIGAPIVENRKRAEANVKYSRSTNTPLPPDAPTTGSPAPDEPDEAAP